MIGILEAGKPPSGLVGSSEDYASMFRRLLGPGTHTQTFDVVGSALPSPDRCKAWLITGGSASAYDNSPWISALIEFVRNIPAEQPLAGICFGHQLMAKAYGGVVAKSQNGRALGVHQYDICQLTNWFDGARTVSLPVGHSDQVVAASSDCQVIGGSEFTPFGILTYAGRRAFSMQSHPEFSIDYTRKLIELRRAEVGNVAADRALASLTGPHDGPRIAAWLKGFLTASDRVYGIR